MTRMLDRTRALTEDKREAVAAELLAWLKIEAAIRDAAAAGQSRVTIAPAVALRIKHTAAARAAIARLVREQFRHQWGEHRSVPAGPTGDQLEIEW